MTLASVSNILVFVISLIASVLFIRLFARTIIRRHQARKRRQPTTYYAQIGNNVYVAPLPGNTYEVGSPEYNAQVTAMLRHLNTRLEKRGVHIPERNIVGLINQSMGFPKDHRMNDPECLCRACKSNEIEQGVPGRAVVTGPAFPGTQVLQMPLVVEADMPLNTHIETGKRFYDHVRINYNTQYDYDSPEAAIAAFTALALEQRETSEQAGNQDMSDFYSGFLMRCPMSGGTDE
jgi:hypothetical protein